jgi:formylglycine-generating enzyme required for sulfatase activity
LALSGALSGATMPTQNDSVQEPFCTWLGATDASNDDKPLNCVPYDTASLACALSGGVLPTEAQWEHAARGRGLRRRYPWGNQDPQCCTLSASRPPYGRDCASMGSGVEDVGSHPPTASCGGLGDESRDGALDMAGSLREALRDELRDYADPCWGKGIVRDPVCTSTASPVIRAAREASWSSGLGDAWLVLRREYQFWGTPDEGFRCVYEGTSP